MTAPQPSGGVTDEQVAAYHVMVSLLARKYDGFMQAEYDDLYQEGMIAVIEALKKGGRPLKEIVRKRMTRWVSKCARQGMVHEEPSDEDDVLT